MKAFLRVAQDLALLIVRVAFGVLMILHGWRRWQGEGIARQIEFLNQTQTPQPELLAWGSVVLEMLGGLFLVFGLLTPLVAAVFLVQQILIIVYSKVSRGPWIAEGGYEYNAMLACLALLLTAFGAGRAGLDNLFKRMKDPEPEAPDTARPDAARSDAARPEAAGLDRTGPDDPGYRTDGYREYDSRL